MYDRLPFMQFPSVNTLCRHLPVVVPTGHLLRSRAPDSWTRGRWTNGPPVVHAVSEKPYGERAFGHQTKCRTWFFVRAHVVIITSSPVNNLFILLQYNIKYNNILALPTKGHCCCCRCCHRCLHK